MNNLDAILKIVQTKTDRNRVAIISSQYFRVKHRVNFFCDYVPVLRCN